MNVILFDDPVIRQSLLPFTFTRPAAAIRTGILTIAEKWEKHLGSACSFSTQEYLKPKFKSFITDDNLWINGAVCPDERLVQAILRLNKEEGLISGTSVIALRTAEGEIAEVISGKMISYTENLTVIDQCYKIFQCNEAQIKSDFALLTNGRVSAPITDPHTRVYSAGNIFLEEGVYIRAAILNAEAGPIYLGKNSIVQEGAIIKGPFALCEGGHVNMGAKIRGNVTIGPYSKVGGEVSTSVIFGYSNKAHDGFLGCSVIGEWCNLGADTNTSNLKNNYDTVKMWNYQSSDFTETGLLFCGLMMGDHAKCSINTMFNTGTVAGVAANIFGNGFPEKFIPSFTWGGSETFILSKALETAARVMERKQQRLTDEDRQMLATVFELESRFRWWERNSKN